MATFVLIHGDGDVGWHWPLLRSELSSRGHDSVAPDLPCDDPSATLVDYANTVDQAVGDQRSLVVVGHSYGAFRPASTAARPATRTRWSASTTTCRAPWPLRAWPEVRTRFVLCQDDRVFPAPFFRRLVPERLGITPDEIAGGHCVALSRPRELADLLAEHV